MSAGGAPVESRAARKRWQEPTIARLGDCGPGGNCHLEHVAVPGEWSWRCRAREIGLRARSGRGASHQPGGSMAARKAAKKSAKRGARKAAKKGAKKAAKKPARRKARRR